MKWFLAALSFSCFLAAIFFGIQAMQGEAIHLASTIVMIIAGFCFAAIGKVGS